MTTVPYGCISDPLNTFKYMLSECPAFQLWCVETDAGIPASGPTRAAACLDYIHVARYELPVGGMVYPMVCVNVPEDVSNKTIAQSVLGAEYDNASGVFDVTMLRVVPVAFRTDAEAAWLNFAGVDIDGVQHGVGAIIEDLKSTLYTTVNPFLNLHLDLADGPFIANEKRAVAHGPLMGVDLQFTWGGE